ncbi:MAG: AAA family ATPase, partial [Lachnospiraceae bacterium]|nr:AAA family ATPase [Lachnospiraceae bacterium]
PVLFEEIEGDGENNCIKAPLFKDFFTEKSQYVLKPELDVPMIAFHSYKGGVGRTLSLIALAKEIAETYQDKKKVLIIDADIEAPGLTWMLNEKEDNAPISYLDVLGLMHINEMNQEMANGIAKLLRKSSFMIETERLQIEEYFLPVYRQEDQTMNIFSTPEKIIATQNNKYIITEFISEIGAALGVDYILVDLRAGITEFSAPYLFDSRVQKYFVSSTSMQSVKGTQLILHEISEKTPSVLVNTKILLTMIPGEMEETTLHQIEDMLAFEIERQFEDDDNPDTFLPLREEYIIRIPFESPLIHLGDFHEICYLLKGKKLSEIMSDLAKHMSEESEEKELSKNAVQSMLSRLNNLTEKEITAEGNASSKMLSTGSIREIVKDYSDVIPQIVVLGAKGSGKTYIYKQMMQKITWRQFLKNADQTVNDNTTDAMILPLICSVNNKYLDPLVKQCVQNRNRMLPQNTLDLKAINENYNYITKACERNLSITEWSNVWRELILNMVGKGFSTLEQADDYLGKHNQKIVFLIDGLEDLFMDLQTQKSENWKLAIRSLCQNVVNELRILQQGNIGIIIFVRKDMAEEAISVNFEQFKNQYSRYELKWTPTDALRLALWLVSQVDPSFKSNIDILKASREALESRLEMLWGKKLGKKDSREANSARWIIAALSDFSGQLQARDIVRFLKSASDHSSEMKFTYPDRYIMPSEIRNAIPYCSKGKYDEIKSEMKATYLILKKFEDMEESSKILPLTLDKINLTGEEISRLESQGYLTTSDKKYYLPEIIRFALGFKYEKGARPKVLSLLTK